MTAARLRAASPYAVYAAIAAWYCAPLFASPHGLGVYDWDQHLFYYASVIKSVVAYRQLPFWNPWYCSGNVLWQNPQVPLLSPVFLLATVMSLPLAMKINIALHYWIGLAGMHRLLTGLLPERSRVVTMSLSSVAVLSGAMAMHLAVGHSVFLPVLYLPWQLHFLIRAIRTGAVHDVVYTAVPLALMIYNGALHAVPMSVAGVAVFSVCAAVVRRRFRPVAIGLLVGVLGASYAAPKLLPVTLFVSSDRFDDGRTTIAHPDAMNVEMLLRTYLDRYQDRSPQYPEQRSGWYEYGNYVGAVAGMLMLASMLVAFAVPGTEERWLGISLAVTGLVFLALSAGEFAAWAPASVAQHLPLFSSFRIPSRYTMAFVLFGVATIGWAWHAVGATATPGRAAVVLASTVAILAALDVGMQTRAQLFDVFSLSPLDRGVAGGGRTTTPPEVDTSTRGSDPDSPMLRALTRNATIYNCYESLRLRRTVAAGLPFIESDGRSRISNLRFSPNRAEFSASNGAEPSDVRLSENAAAGWTSDAGPVIADRRTGMHVTLQPGQAGTFAFRFTPPGLYAGLAIAVLALLGSLAARKQHLSEW